MSNLRLWGYTTQNTNQANASMGLLEKLNKLKLEINKLKDEDEGIEEIETTLNQHVQEIAALTNALSNLPFSNAIDNLQKLVSEIIEKFQTFKTEIEDQNLIARTGELQLAINQHDQNVESLQTQVETIADNLLQFMNKFRTFKTEIESQLHHNYQNLIRRIGVLQNDPALLILQINSKKSKLSANKKVILMNNESCYDVPINFRLKQMKIYSSDNFVHGRPMKFTIHLDSRILITAWGPFSKTFNIERDIDKGQKICFTPNITINSGLYCELIGQAL